MNYSVHTCFILFYIIIFFRKKRNFLHCLCFLIHIYVYVFSCMYIGMCVCMLYILYIYISHSNNVYNSNTVFFCRILLSEQNSSLQKISLEDKHNFAQGSQKYLPRVSEEVY